MDNLIEVAVPPLSSALTYAVPTKLQAEIKIGIEVSVPLGKRTARGFVIGRNVAAPHEATYEIKSIKGTERSYPSFHESQLQFFQWVADYYGDSLSNVIDVAVPKPVPKKIVTRITRLNEEAAQNSRSKKEREMFELIRSFGLPVAVRTLASHMNGAAGVIKRLKARGALDTEEIEILDEYTLNPEIPAWAKQEVALSAAQQTALEQVLARYRQNVFSAQLLHGVTGSGKTEVYIEAVRQVIADGRGALVIVPEIALTPQLIDRFRARLGAQVAVLHSALQPRARWEAWRSLIEKRSYLGIGARSAVFAPVDNLGLVIVDEEHESSYKQAEGLRYNARDLAVVRAQHARCPVLLGSATPSLETYVNCLKKKYHYLSLPARPESMGSVAVQLVDLNRVKPWDMPSRSVSPQLFEALQLALSKGEQAFVLYNRRGFASYLQCERCSSVLQCPHCSVTFTFHQSHNQLLCHYCGLRIHRPASCAKCCDKGEEGQTKPAALVMRGAGTEKIAEELSGLFPQARIDRLDRDAASDAATYRSILDRVRNSETDILVGTQMIAKGHDLPGVTVVGVADCDVGLHMPDFRASERVFQLLTQVAGRAGRGEKSGTVILQTRVPKHPSLQCALTQSFRRFAELELESRKALHYPPFTRLLRIVAHAPEMNLAHQALQRMKDLLDDSELVSGKKIYVLGPAAAPLQKIKNLYRMHVLIKSYVPSHLLKVIRLLKHDALMRIKEGRIVFDLDPQDLL